MLRIGGLIRGVAGTLSEVLETVAPREAAEHEGWGDDHSGGAFDALQHQPYRHPPAEEEQLHLGAGVAEDQASMAPPYHQQQAPQPLQYHDQDYHRRREPSPETGETGWMGVSEHAPEADIEPDHTALNDVVRALESERQELRDRLREAELSLEENTQSWQGVIRDMQQRQAEMLSPLLRLAEEVAVAAGDARVVAEAKRARETQAIDHACDVLSTTFRTLSADRSTLVSGVAEIIDERPPPSDTRELLAKLREAVVNAHIHAHVPPQTDATVHMEGTLHELRAEVEDYRSRCEALERQLLEAEAVTAVGGGREEPPSSHSTAAESYVAVSPQPAEGVDVEGEKQELETLRRRCQQLEGELDSLRAAMTAPVVDERPRVEVAEIERVRHEQQAQEAQFRAEVERWEKERRTLREDLQRLATESVRLKESAKKSEDEVAVLRGHLQRREQELEGVRLELKQRAAEAEGLRSGMKGEREAVHARMQALEKELEATKTALQKQTEEMAALQRKAADDATRAKDKEYQASQLQMVVEQQRNLMRTKADEYQAVQHRLEAAEARVAQLNAEKDQHIHFIREAEAKGQGAAELLAEVEELTRQLDRTGNEADRLRKQGEEARTRLQQAEQRVHELESQLAQARADLQVLSADYDMAQVARDNLQKVLEQFQWEKSAEIKHLGRTHAKRMEELEEAAATKEQHIRRAMQAEISEAQSKATAAIHEAEVEKAKSCALLEQAKKEALSLRKALDEAISRLQFSDSDTVDRKLIANLFVSFFSQRRPRDVLDIIARTLAFTDEDRVRVGLHALSGPQKGLLGGLFSSVGTLIASPRKEFAPEGGVEGRSLGDLWFDYLMNETEDVDDAATGEEGDMEVKVVGGGNGYGSIDLSHSRSKSFDKALHG